MTKPAATCAVCQGKLDFEILSFSKLPAYLVPLPLHISRDVERADLNLHACSSCGHLQVPNPNLKIQKLIYEKYYSHYSVDTAEALVPHYRRPFEEFIQTLQERNLLGGSVLEVGCSSGKAVPLLKRFFKDYCGIDPSDRIQEAATLYPDCEFINGFFPDNVCERTFDAVVSQFNLEHMLDPGEFLEGVRRVSTKGTLLIVQVPNAEDSIRRGWPCFVAHEHVQYFRASTLERLLLNHGFQPVCWGSQGAGLCCAAVVCDGDQLSTGIHTEVEPLAVGIQQKKLAALPPRFAGDRFLFYGVGPILHWCLLQLPFETKVSIVDDNPTYHGMGVPGYASVVQSRSTELLQCFDRIHLTVNDIYYPVVIAKLRASGFNGEVLGYRSGTWNIIDN